MKIFLVLGKVYSHCLCQYSANTNALQLCAKARKETWPLPARQQLQLASSNFDIARLF